MKVITNATGHFFAGYRPGKGSLSLFEPIFNRPVRGEPVVTAIYDTDEDAKVAVNELARRGETVKVVTFVLVPEGAV